MDGDDAEEGSRLPVLGDGDHDQKVGPVLVEVGVVVEGRVLEAVLPAVRALLLPALDPVHVGQPVAGVAVADAVVEGLDLPVEEGAGDELAAALALDEFPVGVDEGELVGGRGLGQGGPGGRDRHQRRQKQRGRQGNELSNRPDSRFQRQTVHLSRGCC